MKNVSRPVIGILGIPVCDDERDAVIALFNDYKNTVVRKGCIPFMISPLANTDYIGTRLRDIPALTETEKEMYREMVDMCDGVIIPGGYRFYEFNKYIAQYALEKDLPILGICMGMQILAQLGRDDHCLVKNETDTNHRQKNVKYVHKVNIIDDTLLKNSIQKEVITVNSLHRYHIGEVKGFKVSAYSEDGLIEGIELPNKNFVIGVQWHPEKMTEYDESADRLFDTFIDECQKYKVKEKK
ncbi:MAG: gamma-glutamyl-gamma-aminobutyrate hydrolase family protein [Bacilli bacterium]|nr:gamma-glutamyl-gamma-aminobutyrate hydrolase family protein [Bacilli bacterium]